MKAIKCKRCGNCCSNMALSLSPKDLKKSYIAWKNNDKRVMQYRGITLIYPMLIPLGWDKKIKRYRYKCKHLEPMGKGKFKCSIQDIKPDLCSTYGESQARMSMALYKPENQEYYPKCVF